MRYAGHLGLRAPDSPLFQHSAGSIAAADQIRFLAIMGDDRHARRLNMH